MKTKNNLFIHYHFTPGFLFFPNNSILKQMEIFVVLKDFAQHFE